MAAPGLVLVHSPLLEASSWSDVAAILQAHGYRVATPDFAQTLCDEPPLYPRIAQNLATVDFPGDLILIAHSGAGALLPVIAAALGARVSGAVFVDALLPHPGKAWFETVPVDWKTRLESMASNGYLPPWHAWWPRRVVEQMLPDETERRRFIATLRGRALAYFKETAPDITFSPSVRCAYFQLSSGYEAEARQARSLGWLVRQEMVGHLGMMTDPDAVALGVRDLLGGLDFGSPL